MASLGTDKTRGEAKADQREINQIEQQIQTIDEYQAGYARKMEEYISQYVPLFHQRLVELQKDGAEILARWEIRPINQFNSKLRNNGDLFVTNPIKSNTETASTTSADGTEVTINGQKYKIITKCDDGATTTKQPTNQEQQWVTINSQRLRIVGDSYFNEKGRFVGYVNGTQPHDGVYHGYIGAPRKQASFADGYNRTVNEYQNSLSNFNANKYR